MEKQQPSAKPHKNNAQVALDDIRQKLEVATQEYSQGKLSAVQFNAIYRHYMEKRTIVEMLLARNPETNAWRAAAAQGHTALLRDRFEARVLYFVVFKRGENRPLRSGGKLPRRAAQQIYNMLKLIWTAKTWRKGVARKSIGDGMWLLLIAGESSYTIVTYFFQPSTLQVNLVSDMQADFERANHNLLARNMPAERMVFPQRALLE